MRYGYLIFILMLMCGIIALSACKPEQDGTGTSEAPSAEVASDTTQEVSPQIQLTLEQLEQYGGAAGMIEGIESYIEEHGTIDDIRDLDMLEPLIKLYYDYTSQELTELYKISSLEIEEALSKVIQNISKQSINTYVLGNLISIGNNETLIERLHEIICESISPVIRDTYIRNAVTCLSGNIYMSSLIEKISDNISYLSKSKFIELDIMPEIESGKTTYDFSRIFGTIKISTESITTNNPKVEVYDRIISWKGMQIGEVYPAYLKQYKLKITSDWLDGYFGGSHGEAVLVRSAPDTNYSGDTYGNSSVYMSETKDGYTDYLFHHPKGAYFGIRFKISQALSVPSPEAIISLMPQSWTIFPPDIERFKGIDNTEIVSDAYALYEKINYEPLFGFEYWHTSIFYVPKINGEGAEELNEQIRRKCLSLGASNLWDITGGTASKTGASINISYEYNQKDNLISIMLCYFAGQLASEASVSYWGYYYDLSEKRKITLSEYIERAGINMAPLLSEINKYIDFKSIFEIDNFKLSEKNIKDIVIRSDGTYDVYIDVSETNYDYGSVIHVRLPYCTRGQWHIYKERSGLKYYEQIVFYKVSPDNTYSYYTSFIKHPSTREYSLNWLDDNTVAVKYWTGEDYSSFFIADLTSKKADCDFDITPERLLGLCGVSRSFSPDRKSTLDIAFARVSGAGTDRTIIASFTAAYEDLSGALKVTGELSMKLDGTGLKATNIKIGT
ncbi:MAG: hypothetical protein AB9835_09810 [Eubacteriales bacterium]